MAGVIVDYGSGNLHSVEKSFRRVSEELGTGRILLSSCPDRIAAADRIILPGVGAFAACRDALNRDGLAEAVEHSTIRRGVPFLGICVGMQLLATVGLEHGCTPGFGWIPGRVEPIRPNGTTFKIPHMGWNELDTEPRHPLFEGLPQPTDVYFVHSYHFVPEDPATVAARTDYGGSVVAAVARDNLCGVQFHPEKSQAAGLRIIGNFLGWSP